MKKQIGKQKDKMENKQQGVKEPCKELLQRGSSVRYWLSPTAKWYLIEGMKARQGTKNKSTHFHPIFQIAPITSKYLNILKDTHSRTNYKALRIWKLQVMISHTHWCTKAHRHHSMTHGSHFSFTSPKISILIFQNEQQQNMATNASYKHTTGN